MTFPLGKPVLALLAVSLACGAYLSARREPPKTDLSLWTFADSHARAYRAVAPAFSGQTGRSLDVRLIPPLALNTRLAAMLMAGVADGLPDVVELDMNNAGPYFRPPAADVGLLPLNHYLENTGLRTIPDAAAPGREGWNARNAADGRVYTFRGGRWESNPARARPDACIDRIVPARLAPWSKGGVVFGVPHDVHPVTITYRHDLFWEDPATGKGPHIDLSAAGTWGEFHEKCLAFEAYWRGQTDAAHPRGYPNRHAMELFASLPDHLVALLLQRGVNLIDAGGRLHLTDPVVADTVAFYAQLVAGPRRVAVESSAGTGPYVNDLIAGNIAATLTPDWRLQTLRAYGGDTLRGKLRMMPLPRFDPADAPTSTWSGTMAGIPRSAPRPDEAWKLIEFLYLGDAGLEARVREGGILPPLRDVWDAPFLHEPDPLFAGGQKTMELYIQLADLVPARQMSWASPVAASALGYVLNGANAYLRAGRPADGLRDYVAGRLAWVEPFVRRYMEHGAFDAPSAGPIRPTGVLPTADLRSRL